MPLDLNHGSGPLGATRFGSPTAGHAEQITARIDEALARQAKAEPPRNYLGASQLGDPCLRKLAYHYRKAPEREPEGRMRRIWARGHAAEARIIGWLREAGFTVVDRAPDGGQIEFVQADGKIAGHVDGVVTAGPACLPYPLLLELKCLNNKSWNALAKKGLATSKPLYSAQCHLYMGYLGLAWCLFGAENADTMELWWSVFPLDLFVAQQASDRGVGVIRLPSGSLPPRIATERSFYLCHPSFCQFSDTCWSDPS